MQAQGRKRARTRGVRALFKCICVLRKRVSQRVLGHSFCINGNTARDTDRLTIMIDGYIDLTIGEKNTFQNILITLIDFRSPVQNICTLIALSKDDSKFII